jgi:pectin methylesterase-like acyl-CoA thioesterase
MRSLLLYAILLSAPCAAADVCPDMPLHLTFADKVTLGTAGRIQVFDASNNTPVAAIDLSSPIATQTIGGLPNYHYYPVIATGNEATIYFPNHSLGYGKSYYVTIDPSVFPNGVPNAASLSFTTKPAPPPAGTTRLIVAADGSGDFATVQGAIDFLPEGNTTPSTIFIRKGTYTELIYVANKHAITFQGEDRKEAIIQYPNNAKFNPAPGVYHRGVFMANHCDDLVLENLTIHNTTPRGGSQAEAIIFNGSPTARAIVSDVDLYSFQDTLQINGQAYINNCRIEGDVDFMWGTGPCYFENCRCITSRPRAFYTQIRNTAKNHGYVYHHCTFDGTSPAITGNYLSRIDPKRFPYSEVVLLDCVLGKSVGPVGWLLNNSPDAPNIHFWEFNSRDTAGNPVDVTQRLAASRQLNAVADATTIANYTNPTFVLGNNWSPQLPAAAAAAATQP